MAAKRGPDILRVKLEDRDLRKDLFRTHRRTVHMGPAWDEVGEIVIRSIQLNFRDEGRPAKWRPFAPSTLKKRQGGKLLQDTGRMLRSISYRKLNNYGIEVGTNLGGSNSYAATHQFGRGPIPARPFVMVQDNDIPEIERAIVDHIVREMR